MHPAPAENPPAARPRWRARAVIWGLLAILAIGVAIARWRFSGPRLARFVTDIAFSGIRGRVEVEAINWPLLGLLGPRLPIEVEGVKIYGPGGELVLDVPRATARVDWLAAAFGHHDVIVDDLVVDGGWAVVREGPRPDDPRRVEVGFTAAFDPARPSPGAAASSAPGPVIHLRSVNLRNIHLELHFADWSVIVDRLRTRGWLRQSFRDPRRDDFTYGLAPRADTAVLTVLGERFDLRQLHLLRFGQYRERPDALAFDVRVHTVEGAQAHVRGALTNLDDPGADSGGLELDAQVHQAGGVLARMFGGVIGGDDAGGRVTMNGKLSAPLLTVDARGLTVDADGIPVEVDRLVGALDLGTFGTTIDALEARVLGGRARARGAGNLDVQAITELSVEIAEPLDLTTLLPPEAIAEAGGARLSGAVRIAGVPTMMTADPIRLQLGGARVGGALWLLGEDVVTTGLVVTAPSGEARLSGRVRPWARTLALEFAGRVERLGDVLRRLGAPDLGRSLVARGRVHGTFDAPIVSARGTVRGAPHTPRVDASVTYRHGPRQLDVTRLTADPLGGTLAGSARLHLGDEVRILDGRVDAERLDLARVPGLGGWFAGTADVRATARGPLSLPTARVQLDAQGLALRGHRLGTLEAVVGVDPRRVAIERLRLGGGAAGALDVAGTVGVRRPHPLDLEVKVGAVPLPLIPGVGDDPRLGVTGTASLRAHVTGSAERPLADGRLSLAGFAILDTILGGAHLDVEPTPDGRLHLSGRLFQGKFAVDASVAVVPGQPLDATGRIWFRRVDLEEFFPDLADRIGAHGWVTGYIDGRTHPYPYAELHLQEVVVDLEGEDADGRPAPLRVRNRGEVVLALDGRTGTTTIVNPIHFVSPTGGFVVEGRASARELALRLRGDVQLALLEFYTRRYVEKARGSVKVDVNITGTAELPLLAGTIAFDKAAVRPPGSETEVRLARGSIMVSNLLVRANDLTLEVDGAELVLNGALTMKDFAPVRIDGVLEGRVAGRLLELVFPESFTSAAGSAAARLTVRGDPFDPEIHGSITIDRPLELGPRTLRREMTLHTGTVRFSRERIALENVTGTIDEGRLRVNGTARLENYEVTSAYLRLQIEGLAHRVPEVLELELTADLNLALHEGKLSLTGSLFVVDGRYVERFRLGTIIVPVRTGERSEPFWKGNPLLANMRLNLVVQTTGSFAVRNNLAQLTADGKVTITGTPPRPALNGEITVSEGTVKIPGTRIKEFAVKPSRVQFFELDPFPGKTPVFQLSAEAPFIDVEQNEHIVYLTLSGTLSGFRIHLWTNTGLNELQTLALITTGRTTDELRAQARGDSTTAVGSDPLTPGGASYIGGDSGVVTASDKIVKDVTGDFISVLIEDPLKNALGLDCVRLGIGTESLQLALCKNFHRNLVLNGEYEQGFRGGSRADLSVDYKAADNVFIVGQGLRRKPEQASEEIQSSARLQLKFRFVIP